MRYHREGQGLRILDEKQLRDEKRWQSLTFKDKVGDWAARHEYSIILGGWAASLGLAGAIISRNKCVLFSSILLSFLILLRYQTYPQKVLSVEADAIQLF